MIISWYGQSCFKIESKGVTIAIDPFEKTLGLTPPRFHADIVMVTHSHPDHANQETIQGSPFIINGPGEYEVKGVAMRGIKTFHDAEEGRERGVNTVYIIEVEEVKLCHLGDFGENEAGQDLLERLGDVDILMIPVGGTYTVDGKKAAHIVSQIEPRMVIPMHYKIPGLTIQLAPADTFLREMGVKDAEPVDKLVIKKKDLPEKETKVLVLKTV